MKRLLITINFILICLISSAQFDPNQLGKSLIKVVVTKDSKSGVFSGFVWGNRSQVITSLHGMKEGGTITILFGTKGALGDPSGIRKASILKTHQDSDLVLLQIEGTPLPQSVIPLKDYVTEKVPFGKTIYALGYNNGQRGKTTRTLKKGYVNPETLESLLPPADLESVSAAKVPAIDLEILYLDGSLLPGYSGSPVVNELGQLIGIGDGGLENGASNVSWVIPAKFISDLENSSTSNLPSGFAKADQAFSAEVTIDTQGEIETLEDFEDMEEVYAESHMGFEFEDFSFYSTKKRSFQEMLETTVDQNNMESFMSDFRELNIQVDYDFLKFDIYEDIVEGVVIAIPDLFNIEAYEDEGYFSVDFEDGYTSLSYSAAKGDFNGVHINDIYLDLIEPIVESYEGNYGVTMVVDEERSYFIEVDDYHQIAYISLDSEESFIDTDGYENRITAYMNVLLSNDKVFKSMASAPLPLVIFDSVIDNGGIDCIEGYDDSELVCDYFENIMWAFSAAHLTTFANKLVTRD
ncbi:MAG: trypsin-like peptidase domain-containing protein [Cyclobacteriaceae bacterium]